MRNEWIYWVISELAFYFFIYYAEVLLNVNADLWVSAFMLWALANVSIIFCPVLRKYFK